jgi:hypothetical protein
MVGAAKRLRTLSAQFSGAVDFEASGSSLTIGAMLRLHGDS